ncbi:MAG TPA: hypothetical protein PKI49_13630 [Pseudomonadota bacterium]|nr:hypothetical protein [Pseudomonadota bacterium]HNK46478.1 hypothetical protein [Pseudomonadota bacterium]HNO69549.1 hypothetical protein [Pseudomonadota bacterium]
MNRASLKLCGTLVLAALVCDSRPARAGGDIIVLPGQQMAFILEGAMATCSLTSIVGNAVTGVRKTPSRAWMYSGFICGFINTATSPIVMIYGTDPKVEYGIGMGLMHGVVGLTNLGLSIWNAHMWHKARTAAPEAPPPAAPAVSLAPMVGRDKQGANILGLSLSASY